VPPPAGPRRSGAFVLVVALLIAGLLGVAVGDALFNRRLTSAISSPTTPYVPSSPRPTNPFNPATPSTGNGSSGTGTSPGASGGVSASVTAIAAKVKPGVVAINTRLGYERATAAGTGIVLTASGEVLTNNHVIRGATTITATVVATGRTYTARVVGTAPSEDLAVLRLQRASGLATVKTGRSSTVTLGDPVVAIGNAGGTGTLSVVSGTVQALNQTITASDQGGGNAEQLSNLIQTDAPIESGDSGGPLVDLAGRVIGVDSAASATTRFSGTARVGYAIPITGALDIVRQIEAGKATDTIHIGLPGFLGVEVVPADAGSGIPGDPQSTTGEGAVVSGVQPGTPADRAGLSEGDTITSVDGQPVTSAEGLTTLLGRHQPHDRVTIGWLGQDGATHRAGVSLGTGPAD
jgi:S1-C subfamily serine protease